MRITELALIQEVKELYIRLRRHPLSREEATSAVLQAYKNGLSLGAEDDGLLVWIGLADAQYACKELTSEIAEKGMQAIQSIEMTGWNIAKGDLSCRKERYVQAPMPEKKMWPARKKFQCQWKNGDTFALKLTEIFHNQEELLGKYVLLQKVGESELWDGRIVPSVVFSVWMDETLPSSVEAFRSIPKLKLNAGKMGTPPGTYEYRALLMISGKKQLENSQLQYVGCFDVKMPDNEVVFSKPGTESMTFLKDLPKDVCLYWRSHKEYEELGIDGPFWNLWYLSQQER